MAKSALSGSPPGRIPLSNVFDWVYSNPFHADSEVLKHGPSQLHKDHNIPRISLDKAFLVDPVSEVSLTFAQAHQDALKVAAGLQNIIQLGSEKENDGLKPVVLIHLPNCLQYAPLLLGVFAAGYTATMANAALTAGELEWIIRSAKPELIISSSSSWKELNAAISGLDDTNLKHSLSSKGRLYVLDPSESYFNRSGTKDGIPQGFKPWSELLSSKPLARAVQLTEAECRERTAVILWSSGTSGKSKGVCISHSSIIACLVSVWHGNTRLDQNERWLGFVPFFHTFGLNHLLLSAPCCGATIYTMQKFDPQQMLSLVQKYRITHLHMAPPVALLLAKSPMVDGVNMSSIKAGVSGGAPLGVDAIEAVYKRLGIMTLMGYGLSEAGAVCQQVARDWKEIKMQLGSTGLPMYGVELKIISTEDATRVLNIDDAGEILIRSPSNMQGYLKNKEATDESLDKDGWFHTGDVGNIDSGGRLWVTDRLKEVIKVKGFQVSPADLESILCSSDSIADAGVTSIYDEEAGTELPRAYIVPKDLQVLAQCVPDGPGRITSDLQKLADHVKSWVERNTTSYKWLRGNVVFIQQVPKSPSGKILRRLLKETKGVEVEIYANDSRRRVSKI